MNVKPLIIDLKEDVKDVHNTEFEFFSSGDVPSVEDSRMTFAYGETKKGQIIETCVLFVDIRNSIELNKKHQLKTMEKLYTAFTRGVLTAAKFHGGMVRNIIGDRVMVVFPEDGCFKNSVDCAITINHLAKLIRQEFSQVDFHVGIGIDYGTMHVIKVGLISRGDENAENKNLVWIGKPANLASRLTDQAGKAKKNTLFNVTYLARMLKISNTKPAKLTFTDKSKVETMDTEKLADFVSKYNLERIEEIESVEKVKKDSKYPPILVSEAVYTGFKNACPEYNSVKNGWWKEQKEKIRDIDFNVFGADLTWVLN